MADTLRDIPEFTERELGESLEARNNAIGTFKALGAPDFCHITKVNAKPGVKDIPSSGFTSSYHFVSGVDASNSASLAAYLNSLNYAIDETHTWFSSGVSWRIRSGVYCCYNAFSRVDIRVVVKIPGGVESYAVNAMGEGQEITPLMWQETYLSAILRAILHTEENSQRMPGLRQLDPFPDVAAEKRFFEAAEQLFFRGWLLGSNPETQVPTIVNNHLTAAIVKYCKESFRYDLAITLFEKLFKREPEIASLLAEAYIGADDEQKAVQVLYKAVVKSPQSYALLDSQSDFVRDKGRLDMALKLSKEAVNCAPSEYTTWAKLTDVYIELGDFHNALLTLNSCPMFAYNEKDVQRLSKPAKVHLPIRNYIDVDLIDEEPGHDEEIDPALARLPAATLRGTFEGAYKLLTKLVSRIGWDELLRCRSLVFVMEEEYRAQKEAEEEFRKKSKNNVFAPVNKHAAEKQHSNSNSNHQEQEVHPESANNTSSAAPAIKISTASDHDRVGASGKGVERKDIKDDTETNVDADADAEPSLKDVPLDDLSLDDAQEQEQAHLKAAQLAQDVAANNTQKPASVYERSEEENDNGNDDGSVQDIELTFSFSHKRLCDRWLDNLFMVLYEDLRQYAVWRAEVEHYRRARIPYHKAAGEWQIFGDLAMRLQHHNEALEAYQHCVSRRFMPKALYRMLEIYADDGEVIRAMDAAIRLCVYQERWYQEAIFPSAVAYNLNKLIYQYGWAMVHNTLVALNTSPTIYKMMQRILNRAKEFQVPGYDA
ncbi:hypothetical protein BGZ94_005271 [Podila epigama]|nr:hypothetical protein BGZ94_005271 [Podila epigama]